MPDIPASVVDDAVASLRRPFPRPNPLQWLKYAFGRPLPERYHTWVLHDVTAPTWVLRHAARSLVLLAVPILVVLLLPIPLTIRLLILANAGLPALLASMIFILSACERRLIRAGYRAELGTAVRTRLSSERQMYGNRLRRERRARRRGAQ
jgi:hypothetical protein